MLGRHLKPGLSPKSPKERVASVFGLLPHRLKAGKTMRLGPGAGCLVTEDRAVLVSDVVPPEKWPSSLEIIGSNYASASSLLTNTLMSPPNIPFLLILFGKKTDIAATLRMSASPDIVEICGQKPITVRRNIVIEALGRLGFLTASQRAAAVPVPGKLWREACRLNAARVRDPAIGPSIERRLSFLAGQDGSKAELVQRAVVVAESGPMIGTSDWDALSSLVSTLEKCR